MISRSLLGFILLILLGSLWGTGYSIARFAVTNGVSAFGYSFWQSLGPAIIIGLIALFTGKYKLQASHLRFYLITGLTGIAIPNTTMYFTAGHLPAGVLAMVVNIVPVVAYPMALLLKFEKFHWQRLVGILIAMCGLLAVILPGSSMPPSMTPWIFLTLITPISFAICTLYIAKHRPHDLETCHMAAGMLISSSLILMPIVLLTNNLYVFHLPFTTADWVIILEMILSSVGYLLLFYLIKLVGPVYYSLVDTIVVVTGLFWGYVIFGEQLNPYTSIALVCILSALLIMTHQQRKALQLIVET